METYKILVVDDEERFRNSIKRLFRMMPGDITLEALEASNGRETVAVLEKTNVDCVLLDLYMPGGSGIEWIGRILEQFGDVAIVMVTGAGSEEAAVESMKQGATDYLVKGSILPENLQRAILNAVQKVRMRKQLKEQKLALIDAERQRVMIQSLGAACHHISQPATVIKTYLSMMKKTEKQPDMAEMIDNCLTAVDVIADILNRLRQASEYRTVPYRPLKDGEAPRVDDAIVDI